MNDFFTDTIFDSPIPMTAEKLRADEEYDQRNHQDPLPTEIGIEIYERRIIQRMQVIARNGYLVKQQPMRGGGNDVIFPAWPDLMRGPHHAEMIGMRSRFVWYEQASDCCPQKLSRLLATRPIPGELILLDPENRTGRIVDPLGWRSNRAFLDEIRQVSFDMGCGRIVGTWPDVWRRDMTDEDIATWQYHMRKLLTTTISPAGDEYQLAVEYQNCSRLPSMEESAATGLVRLMKCGNKAPICQPDVYYQPDNTVPPQRAIPDTLVPLFLSEE